MYLHSQPTSFVKVVLELIILAHHVRVSSDANVYSIVLMHLPIVQLVMELVRRGVERVSALVVLIAVVVIKNGGLADGHADDRAAVLVSASRDPVAVAALRPEQDRGDVVDLVSGLRAGTLLGNAAPLAPPVAGVQHEGEQEN